MPVGRVAAMPVKRAAMPVEMPDCAFLSAPSRKDTRLSENPSRKQVR